MAIRIPKRNSSHKGEDERLGLDKSSRQRNQVTENQMREEINMACPLGLLDQV